MNHWSDEQKEQALRLYRVNGAAHASGVLGIPQGTIRRWASERGERTLAPKNVEAAVEATRLKWSARRLTMADEVGEVAQLALDKVREMLEGDKLRDAASGTTAFGTLVDKAQLLSGGATSRQHVDHASLVEEAKAKVLSLVPQRQPG